MVRAVQDTEVGTHGPCIQGLPVEWGNDPCVPQWHQTGNSVAPGESL